MAHTASISVLPAQFDDFLFAQIGEDGNGMLSVISALARLDLDPWQEAANLAQLPKATAARRLASLIVKLPGLPLAQRDIAATAASLIARLPRLAGSPVAATKTLLGADVSARARAAIRAYPFRYVWLILAVFMLGGLSIAVSQLTARHIDSNSPPTAGTDIPQASPPNDGR